MMLIIPLFWNQGTVVANAATTPTFVKSKVEIVGVGETYQLGIKNKVAGSKYKWSSSDTKIAKVTSKGLVTTVNKGSTNIKCKITYPSKKTKTLSCKVTVTIPATEIAISNAVELKGSHRMTLGQTFDFNTTITPANSSDKVFWSIEDGDADCIRIDNNTEGTITATKAGTVVLRATAAKTATQAAANNSIINDAVIIEVVGPTATVRSAEIVGSSEIKVVFDSPVDKNTVIGINNKLTDNIGISMLKDIKGVVAKDPGALTASLSTDLQTLTITTANTLEGIYGISFSSKILTTNGVAMEQYYKQITYIDLVPPAISNVELDDSGMIATIKFTEAVDFTNFNVTNAAEVNTSNASTVASQVTISTLNNKLNYIPSTDKKSLTINLSKISVSDYGKIFSVIITGIKDLSGNSPASFTLPAYLRTDNTKKAQIVPVMIVRTSYYTITATFNRAVKDAGIAQVRGGAPINGIIDTTDNKKVNYTLTEADAQLSGYNKVTVGYWNGYNVVENDYTAQQMREFSVDFTADKTSPVLLLNEYDAKTGILTLTYNEDVNVLASTGIFSATLITVNDDIKPGTNVNFTKLANVDGNKKIIKLQLSNINLAGNYTFNLDQGFALDSFKNMSLARVITVSNTNGVSGELPGPYLISQSSTNLSEISLEFINKLDVATAEQVGNYKIAGATIISARVTKNTSDNGATVLLTVADGSIDVTVERPVTVTGVRGYNGSYSAITTFTKSVELKDNKKPYYIDAVFDKTSKNIIRLNFSEQIKGNLLVKVTQIGTVAIDFSNTVTISGNSAYINLTNIPMNGAYLKIDIINNAITDLSGNSTNAMTTTMGVMASY
jgi:hypothetical protein